jgi:hypothetical protein
LKERKSEKEGTSEQDAENMEAAAKEDAAKDQIEAVAEDSTGKDDAAVEATEENKV